jgi:hypothetical protein
MDAVVQMIQVSYISLCSERYFFGIWINDLSANLLGISIAFVIWKNSSSNLEICQNKWIWKGDIKVK